MKEVNFDKQIQFSIFYNVFLEEKEKKWKHVIRKKQKKKCRYKGTGTEKKNSEYL